MKGVIHSVESAGTLDGPGIRYVLFLHGCPMRCLFCHNPDTWALKGNKVLSAEEVFEDIKKYVDFFRFSGGGVTISGGEPFLQRDFLIELLKLLKAASVHTAIDTCGYVDIDDKTREIVDLADLFLLDIKHTDPAIHKELTGKGHEKTLEFLQYLCSQKKRIWIRCVLVENYSSDLDYAGKLARYLSPYIDKIARIELLPYHTLGVHKWENIGIEYKLGSLKPTSAETVKAFKSELKRLLNISDSMFS